MQTHFIPLELEKEVIVKDTITS